MRQTRLNMYLDPKRLTVRSRTELFMLKRLIKKELDEVEVKRPDDLRTQMGLINLYHKTNSASKKTQRP